MGCSAKETTEIQTKKDIIEYESYSKSDPKTLDIILYSLDWKTRPEICIFQKLSEKTIDKDESPNIDDLIEIAQFEEVSNIESLSDEGYIIFYIYIEEGVVITRNMEKINFFLGMKFNEVIKICIVDISSVVISESEYFSIYEVKKQTKYFFDLTNKEISFTERNNRVNYGKDENLSDTEIDLRDEEIEEEQEKSKYVQVVNQSILLGEKKEGEEAQENENVEENNNDNNDNDINEKEIELNNNNNSNTKENTEVRNFQTTKNEEINENIQEEENNESTDEEKPYEIIDDTLIISASEITDDTLKILEKNFFVTGANEQPPYQSIGYWELEPSKKTKKRKRKEMTEELINRNQEEDEEYSDYILINKNNGIPYEKKICLNKIKKIIFKKCSFSNSSNLYNLKRLIIMLTKFKFLITSDFIGWKFFRQILKENFSIRWVSFRDAGFNDTIFEQIISGMTLKRIRYLNISKNNITNKGLYFLNKFLMKNQTLLILDMSDNRNVTVEGIKLIANALKMHPNISKIILSNNNLNGAGKYIGTLIKDNKSLKTLLIRNVSFEFKDIEFLAEEMCKKNCSIKDLDIGLNSGIGDSGLIEIGKIIDNNKSLTSIGLDGLNLTMNNYLPVFQAIFKNKIIEKYSLNNNEGLPLKGILNFFLKNPNVKELSITPWDVDNNKDKVFDTEQLIQIERFHLKSPNVIIHGIKFTDNEN